jgi:hypothetical protein
MSTKMTKPKVFSINNCSINAKTSSFNCSFIGQIGCCVKYDINVGLAALGLVRVSKNKSLKDDFAHYKLNVGENTSALG